MTQDIRLTEEKWLAGDSSWHMLHHLLNVGAFPARKQLQFCVAVCRLRGETLPAGYRAALLDLEAIAEGPDLPDLEPSTPFHYWLLNSRTPLKARFDALSGKAAAVLHERYQTLLEAHESAHWEGDPRFKVDDAVFYAMMGHVFACCYCDAEDREAHSPREADLLRELVGNPFRPCVLYPTWLVPPVSALAAHAREARAFDVLPILADALEEAGCDDAALLTHLRSPGPHVRGCWALDAILTA